MTRLAADVSDGETSFFVSELSRVAAQVNTTLEDLLPVSDGQERRVVEAMRYAALDGGKRLRPFLVVASATLFDVDQADSMRTAAAIEMVHCYSLVHDDLPAMDDDEIRRGRATVHKAFDEATAILAGDALLTRALEVLAEPETESDPAVRLALILTLTKAAGASGMVGGQMLDLMSEDVDFDEIKVQRMQKMKTGCLITAACESGAILGRASADHRKAVGLYGRYLGAAFQIADDLIDFEGSAETAGKKTGKDKTAGKATFVSLSGPEHARTRAQTLANDAVDALTGFGTAADLLRETAAFVIRRQT